MKTTLLALALLCLQFTFLKSQTWIPQGKGIFPAGYAIYGISVPSDSVVWVIASNYNVASSGNPVPASHVTKVARSTDGGETWLVNDIEEAMGRLSWDVEALDANTAWITAQDYGSGAGRALFKTEDGGVTWTQMTACRGCGVFVRVSGAAHIYAQGNPYRTWSLDGGQTWEADTLGGYQSGEFNVVVAANNMADMVGDTVWVGTTNGRIVRSTNYGSDTEFFDTGFPYIQCVSFKDHLQGMLFWYESPSNFGLARTFDGGATWEATPTKPQTSKEYNVTYVPGTEGSYVTVTDEFGVGSEVFWTTDFGETWVSGGAIEGAKTNAVDFHSPQVGWAAWGGFISNNNTHAVFKWSVDSTSAAREPILHNLDLRSFPSPFSETLQVQVDFSGFHETASSSLEVHTLDGREVFMENIETQPILNKTIDTQGWASGPYLLKVRTEKGIVVQQILKQ